MELHIYSVKAKSEAGNIWVKIQWQHKKTKATKYQLGILKVYIFYRKTAEGLESRIELDLSGICLWEYTQKHSSSRKGAAGA